MKMAQVVSIGVGFLVLQACSHPIDIVGEGDVTSASGNRTCLLEDYLAAQDNCSKNYVVGAYQETYFAVPRVGWQFDHWGNYCAAATTNECSFNISAAVTKNFWGQTAPPLQAVFAKYKLTGPVQPDSGISLGMGVQDPGYQKKEFFLSGTAHSYTPTLPLPVDGKLFVTADPEIAGGNYKTRLVVQRPINPADFNGTVVVEWLNVSAGADSPPDWIMAHNELIRGGFAWVGVSAQAIGVNALKSGAAAARYATLVHPSDSYSYGIFSQAGLLAGENASTLLGGLTADRVLGVGESQSAFRLVTYIDAIHPIEPVFDGFLVHSRWGSGTPISQAPLPTYSFPAPAPIRDDLDVPVIIVEAEGDVILSNLDARQPDTSMIRLWEMAGTSHADAYTLAGLNDAGNGSSAIAMFGFLRAPSNPLACTNPINAGPHHWILQAAFRGLDTWVRTGVAPPSAPRLDVNSTSPLVLARDAYGNALGGVRSPHLDAPVATLDSVNSGAFAFCGLFGRTVPFPVSEIESLYTSKEDFLSLWLDAINDSVAGGFLLQEDADELEAAAETWQFPN
jgi:hypothetical protein